MKGGGIIWWLGELDLIRDRFGLEKGGDYFDGGFLGLKMLL